MDKKIICKEDKSKEDKSKGDHLGSAIGLIAMLFIAAIVGADDKCHRVALILTLLIATGIAMMPIGVHLLYSASYGILIPLGLIIFGFLLVVGSFIFVTRD